MSAWPIHSSSIVVVRPCLSQRVDAFAFARCRQRKARRVERQSSGVRGCLIWRWRCSGYWSLLRLRKHLRRGATLISNA